MLPCRSNFERWTVGFDLIDWDATQEVRGSLVHSGGSSGCVCTPLLWVWVITSVVNRTSIQHLPSIEDFGKLVGDTRVCGTSSSHWLQGEESVLFLWTYFRPLLLGSLCVCGLFLEMCVWNLSTIFLWKMQHFWKPWWGPLGSAVFRILEELAMCFLALLPWGAEGEWK